MQIDPLLQQVEPHTLAAGQQLPFKQVSPLPQQVPPQGIQQAPLMHCSWPWQHAAPQSVPWHCIGFVHAPLLQTWLAAQQVMPHGFGQPPPPPPPHEAANNASTANVRTLIVPSSES